ncbi:MAG: hypothetical protein PHU40_10725 [Sulfurimonas sp.]|nr:hypothetical protein [Sulfurimonas sp.]
MSKILLLLLLLFTSLVAQKVLYLSYSDVPKRVIKGEIFTITLKSLSTIEDLEEIQYDFSQQNGIEVLNDTPNREKKGKYFYDTFYLIATTPTAKTPDIQATLVADDEYESAFLSGMNLDVVSLNPPKNFSNIIADNFELVEYRTTAYDHDHNIIVFVAQADNSAIEKMRFKDVYKQGTESVKKSYTHAKITYFIVVDKKIENFSFSYFNVKKNKFLTVSIPVVVDADRVTTQTDLKPQDQSHDKIKIVAAIAVVLLLTFFILWRKKYRYFVLVFIPLAYIVYMNKPSEEICIKEGAKIRLLPVYNGTIFETTSKESNFIQDGRVGDFIKVELPNEQIGWVKHEDTCSR